MTLDVSSRGKQPTCRFHRACPFWSADTFVRLQSLRFASECLIVIAIVQYNLQITADHLQHRFPLLFCRQETRCRLPFDPQMTTKKKKKKRKKPKRAYEAQNTGHAKRFDLLIQFIQYCTSSPGGLPTLLCHDSRLNGYNIQLISTNGLLWRRT